MEGLTALNSLTFLVEVKESTLLIVERPRRADVSLAEQNLD